MLQNNNDEFREKIMSHKHAVEYQINRKTQSNPIKDVFFLILFQVTT